ncbi:MAG: riboflavin biosynthesis protein RibF [Verrucomicrobiaceae bacterium]|nr:riboflavin biosynthesis protein RibF [Verrucomicrobiaceae bacterium]
MELIRDLHNLRPRHRGCVATVGAFDGVHRGHQAVLKRLIQKGREMGLPVTVIVFEPLPREFFAPAKSPARLMSFREKFVALRELGIDRVLRLRFDRKFSDIEADAFVRITLVDGLDVRYMVVGDEMHFGKNRAGDFEYLHDAGKRFGFEVVATSAVEVAGDRVSSTRIRHALEQADFALAEQLLGRPYRMSGRVMVGQQLGRTIGVPTANLQLRRLRAPLSGVYATRVFGAGPHTLPGVANIGTRPTIGDLTKAILEVHILDFVGDLYHRNISVEFCKKLRDERKFDSIEQLKQQIQRDIDTGRQYFG